MKIRFGFFEFPDVPKALERCRAYGLALEPDSSTFFLGREDAGRRRASRPQELAHRALHLARDQRPVARPLLPAPAGPRGGARHADHDLRIPPPRKARGRGTIAKQWWRGSPATDVKTSQTEIHAIPVMINRHPERRP
ncbi:MAG: hypothetical protein WDM81_16310 [Rhizomicrobium sp.]